MALIYSSRDIKPYQEIFSKITSAEDDFIKTLIKGLGVNIKQDDKMIAKELEEKNLKLSITDCFNERYYYCNDIVIGHRIKQKGDVGFIYRKVNEDEY